MRPYVLLSCAVSVDGYIDDTTDSPLLLSNDEDFDRVDEVRASCDAILVGANTIRRDNPRLLVRSPARRAARVARGLPEHPAKVTITRGSSLDPASRFFVGASRFVYAASPAVASLRSRLDATVIDAGDPIALPTVLSDLYERGIRRLMVEGGTTIHTQLLTQDLVDEVQLVVAPRFVGDRLAPRFVTDGVFPKTLKLTEVRQMGDCVLLRYGTVQ